MGILHLRLNQPEVENREGNAYAVAMSPTQHSHSPNSHVVQKTNILEIALVSRRVHIDSMQTLFDFV